MLARRLVYGTATLLVLGGWSSVGWMVVAHGAGAGFLPEPIVPAPRVVRTDPHLLRPLDGTPDELYTVTRTLAPGQIESIRRRSDRDPGDVRAHALLLQASWLLFERPGMNELHNEEVAWFAANLPGSPFLRDKRGAILPFRNAPTRTLVVRLLAEALTKHLSDPEIALALARFRDEAKG